MSSLLPRIDHIAQGLSRTISQYRGKPAFNTLCAIYLQQLQYIEDAMHASVDAWDVDTAVGFRLRILGELVGQPNVSADDEVQRIFTKARIRSNRSRGKIGDLTAIADLLIPGYRYYEYSQHCYFEIEDTALTYSTADAVWQMLQRTAGAGVRVHLTWTPTEDIFYLAPTGAVVEDEPNGLCSTSETLPAHAGGLSAGL